MISGTDTLGVGVNIPIRTVLFTQLCKFDGEKTRILAVRDFKQIAGRAGRKGFDNYGYVVAQAPAHVIENKRLDRQVALAASEGKKKKVVKKQPPTKGYVAWSEDTFHQLVDGIPEALESRFSVSHGMLLELMQRPDNAYVKGGGYRRLVDLIGRSHESDRSKRQLRRRARGLFQSLVKAQILKLQASEYFRGREASVSTALQTDFSLLQTLSLFLVEALETLDPKHPEYALDVVSFCEAILEDPRAILNCQLHLLKTHLISEWKAEGIEYDERMKRLEQVTWPKPKADHLYALYDIFQAAHPWVGHENVSPKAIMRDMHERYMTFNEYVKELGLERIEGTLLRYLSEGFKTLVRTVPAALRTDELMDVIAFFRTVLARVDASLIQEWERLMYGAEETVVPELAAPLDITKDRRAFHARIRAELHAFVKALASRDWEEAAALLAPPPEASEMGLAGSPATALTGQAGPSQMGLETWTPERIAAAIAPFEAAHGTVVFDHRARMTDKTFVIAEGRHLFTVRQTLVARATAPSVADLAIDPDSVPDAESWYLEGVIDLRGDPNPEGALIMLRAIAS